jgi:trk system potassium uptake protein TrkA
MRILVMGCGRTGARAAAELDREGHSVTVIDVDSTAFNRLPRDFGGETLTGNGMDSATLERAGIEQTDLFIATTQGDNRNVFASQLARVVYRVPRVICRLYDPEREEIFRQLGLETVSPTRVMTGIIVERVRQGAG